MLEDILSGLLKVSCGCSQIQMINFGTDWKQEALSFLSINHLKRFTTRWRTIYIIILLLYYYTEIIHSIWFFAGV